MKFFLFGVGLIFTVWYGFLFAIYGKLAMPWVFGGTNLPAMTAHDFGLAGVTTQKRVVIIVRELYSISFQVPTEPNEVWYRQCSQKDGAYCELPGAYQVTVLRESDKSAIFDEVINSPKLTSSSGLQGEIGFSLVNVLLIPDNYIINVKNLVSSSVLSHVNLPMTKGAVYISKATK
jgi:hypothetical protein